MAAPTRSSYVPHKFLEGKPIHMGEGSEFADIIWGGSKRFKPVKLKDKGSEIGTIYKLTTHAWMGKLGSGVPEGSRPLRDRIELGLNLEAITEFIVGTFYGAAARNAYVVPEMALSKQPIFDRFTKDLDFPREYKEEKLDQVLRVMSCYVDGYIDFAEVFTVDEKTGARISYMQFLHNQKRPPEVVCSPEGDLVPIFGDMEIFANARAFADTDVLGGSGKNAGIIWMHDEAGKTIGARAVKIDPGYGFQFKLKRGDAVSRNVIINQRDLLGDPKYWFRNRKDIQLANAGGADSISFDALSQRQKDRYLNTLFTTMDAFTPAERMLFLERDGAYNRGPNEGMPHDKAQELSDDMEIWFNLQRDIYNSSGADLKKNVYFNYPAPVTDFQGRTEILGQLARELRTTPGQPVKVVSLCGEGGCGKSEIARKGAYNLRGDFSVISWIESETPHHQLTSYLEVAQTLGIKVDEKISLGALQRIVHRHLENMGERWLLIFDNLEAPCPWPSQGGSVLITSKMPVVPVGTVIHVERFSLDEGVEFLAGIAGTRREKELLVGHLKGNPLALRNAVDYIKARQISLTEYLGNLAKCSKKMGSTEGVVLVTNESLEVLKAQGDSASQEAYQWINMTAFLDPTEITDEWVVQWVETQAGSANSSQTRARKILDVLNKLHLIRYDWQSGTSSIHRNVQAAIQKCQSKDESQRVFLETVEFVDNQFRADGEDPQTWPKARKWLLHAEQLWKHPLMVQVEDSRPLRRATLARHMGQVYEIVENFQDALKYFEIAFSFRETQASVVATADYADSAQELGEALHAKGYYEDAITKLALAHALYDSSDLPTKNAQLGKIQLSLGFTYIHLGKYKQALEAGLAALSLQEALYGKIDHFDIARTYMHLGAAYHHLRDHKKGAECHTRAHRMLQVLAVNNNAPTLRTLQVASLLNMGASYSKLGKYAKALPYLQQCLELSERIWGSHCWVKGSCHLQYGRALVWLKKFDEARYHYQSALDITTQLHGADSIHPETACPIECMGDLAAHQGNFAEARDRYAEALSKLVSFFGEDSSNPEVGNTHYKLACMLQNLGHAAEAAVHFKKAANKGFEPLPASCPIL